MVDFNALNGPIRQIPGTQNTHDQPPQVGVEPEWMKLSTVMPLKAGGVIIRDLRAWVSELCAFFRLTLSVAVEPMLSFSLGVLLRLNGSCPADSTEVPLI